MTTITIDRAVVKQALKALDWFVTKEMTLGQRYTNGGQTCLDAITALRSALNPPKQPSPFSRRAQRELDRIEDGTWEPDLND